MPDLSPETREYYAGLLDPYRRLDAWAKRDAESAALFRRLEGLAFGMVFLGAIALAIWAMFQPSSPPRATPAQPSASGPTLLIILLAGGAVAVFGVRAISAAYAKLRRSARPTPPLTLSPDQITFMAAASLAEALKRYGQTRVPSYFVEARHEAAMLFGTVSRDLSDLLPINSKDSASRPNHRRGVLVSSLSGRTTQARVAANAMVRQRWITYPVQLLNDLQLLGWADDRVAFCMEGQRALGDVEALAIAIAELSHAALRVQTASRTDRSAGALGALVREVLETTRQLPSRPPAEPPVPRTPRPRRLASALRRPRLLWSFVAWLLVALFATAITTMAADYVLHLSADTKALIIVPTAVVAASTLTALRSTRTFAVADSTDAGSEGGPATAEPATAEPAPSDGPFVTRHQDGQR